MIFFFFYSRQPFVPVIRRNHISQSAVHRGPYFAVGLNFVAYLFVKLILWVYCAIVFMHTRKKKHCTYSIFVTKL